MPTYTYRCKDCSNEFEKRQRMSDDPLTECPTCGGYVRRVVNSVGIVFKGSGFYVTDNRNGRKNGSSAATAKTKSDSDSKTETDKAENNKTDTTTTENPKTKSKKEKTAATT